MPLSRTPSTAASTCRTAPPPRRRPCAWPPAADPLSFSHPATLLILRCIPHGCLKGRTTSVSMPLRCAGRACFEARLPARTSAGGTGRGLGEALRRPVGAAVLGAGGFFHVAALFRHGDVVEVTGEIVQGGAHLRPAHGGTVAGHRDL